MTTHALNRRRGTRTGQESTAPSALPRATVRKDIQGLRALAVVSVALDHAHVPGLAGGFVGVDIFFVISGYLITLLLVREAQQAGRISLSDFYSRRARRILPAAAIVLTATVVSSSLLLGFVRASQVIRESVWAAAFAANIRFARDETDYFSADNPPSPLQHFWSLAVEEQFYLVWPLVVVGVLVWLRFVRRRRQVPELEAGRQLRVLAIVVALASGVSLIWCIVLTGLTPTAAYFSTPARAWELGVGATCAALGPRIARWSVGARAGIGWLGLGGIVASIVCFSPQTVFPGHAAMLPVLGTALVIASGEKAGRFGPQPLLEGSPAQRIGAWSYSLYLWHWPVLVIAAGYAGHPLTVAQNLALLVAALVLSAVTYHVVENPFRRSRLLRRHAWRGLAIYPAALALTFGGCVVAQGVISREVAATSTAPPITVHDFGVEHEAAKHLSEDPAVALVEASVEAARHGMAIPGHLSPPLLELRDDVAETGDCDYTSDIRRLCRRGDVGSGKILVALGDSHARAWIPALEVIAKRQGYATYYLVKPGCNAGSITPDVGSGAFEGCVTWRTWALEQIEDLHPDILVIASDLPPAVVTGDGTIDDQVAVADAMSAGLIETITALDRSVARIVVVGDPPGMPVRPADCLSTRGADLGDCAFPRSRRSELLVAAEMRAAQVTGVDFIDTLGWFCAEGLCPSVVGSTVTYRDLEHITTAYALQLATPLQLAMRPSSSR